MANKPKLFTKSTIHELKIAIEKKLYDNLHDPNLAMDHGVVLGLASVLMGREELMIALLLKTYLTEKKIKELKFGIKK